MGDHIPREFRAGERSQGEYVLDLDPDEEGDWWAGRIAVACPECGDRHRLDDLVRYGCGCGTRFNAFAIAHPPEDRDEDEVATDGGQTIHHLEELVEIEVLEVDGQARLGINDGTEGASISVPEELIPDLREAVDEIEDVYRGGGHVRLVPDGGE